MMEQQAATLLSTLKKPSAQTDTKVAQLNALKSDIKHYRVPETAQAAIFECIRLSIAQQASSSLASTAFSTLGHLLKRLKIQDNSGHAITQLAPRLFPALQERLGDMREPVRAAASQALSDMYQFLAGDVEHIIRDEAISGSNARAKDTGMRWVARMHRDEGMPFKGYTQCIVARLEDADGTVRDSAKSVVIELFSSAPDRAKLDLKKQLKVFAVRHGIASQILAAIGAEGSGAKPQAAALQERGQTPDLATSTRSLPALDHVAHFAETINSEAAQPPPQEAIPMDPIYLHSQRELEDIFRDMLSHFEGKETEQNWVPRDKSILKIRRILKGNSPSEYHHVFMAGIKSIIEGIVKVANSLRTTMATNGCQLVQELAKTLGPALDPHVEILLQSFIKMSAATKHIAAENGKHTASEIFQNCSYSAQMMRHIWFAAQEKNVQQRQCSMVWLTILLKRQASYKSSFESSGGLELAEKSLKKSLDDANPKVKEGARATYWTFAKTWPDKADKIMSSLDPKSKTALERDSHNPNAILHQSVTTASTSSRTGGTSSRTALREMMEQQRKAKASGKLPSRPNSAMADLSPTKSRSHPVANGTRGPSNLSKVTNRQESSTSNTANAEPLGSSTAAKKGSSLMSGPVRRPRRPEIARPQTADPYTSRRLLRPTTPANGSPAHSPEKGTGASKASTTASSSIMNRAKIAENANCSPGGSPARRSPVMTVNQPASGSRPTSKGSETIREDDLTMVMPKGGATSRGQFSPGHKRSGLGETRSVDSAFAAMGDEDNFTMVMPSLRNGSRARSPLAYRSPIKAMFDEARQVGTLSPDAQRTVSGSLEQQDVDMNGTKEAVASKNGDDVQIYEDPFIGEAAQPGAQEERKVLGELPVNPNNRPESPAPSVGSSGSPNSPAQAAVARPGLSSTPQDRAEVVRNGRLLASGIERIRTKNLDAHGFRRLQELAKSRTDIWDGGKRYDELMSVLLDYLRTVDQDSRLAQQPSKIAGLKAQALGLVRALLALHKANATKWQSKALVTVLITREGVENSSHLVADMQRTIDAIVIDAKPATCIDALLDFMSEVGPDVPRTVAMSFIVLRQLVIKSKDSGSADLGFDRRTRLVQTTARYLNDADSEVRKVDVDLASELFECFDEQQSASSSSPSAGKAEFWGGVQGCR